MKKTIKKALSALAALVLAVCLTAVTAPAYTDVSPVVKGDSLWKIASKQLGNGSRWTEIYDLNKDTVKSPSVIFVGQILKMPLTAVSQ